MSPLRANRPRTQLRGDSVEDDDDSDHLHRNSASDHDQSSASGMSDAEPVDLGGKLLLQEHEARGVYDSFEPEILPAPPAVFKEPQVETTIVSRRDSSFFARATGLMGVDIAASGRSKCFHCNNMIARDSIRFQYTIDPKRPHRHIHLECVKAVDARDVGASIEWLRSASQQSCDVLANACVDAAVLLQQGCLTPMRC